MPISPFSMSNPKQNFRQAGRIARRSRARTFAGATSARDVIPDFQGAAEDVIAMSERLAIASEASARRLADAMIEATKDYIRQRMPIAVRSATNTDTDFEFSRGRLAAAFGRYTPDDMTSEVQDKHEQWASDNGVDYSEEELPDGGEEVVEMGALYIIRRLKSNIWTAEVGTFLPYAGLVQDGGTMEILPWGNPRARPRTAYWTGIDYIGEGLAKATVQMDGVIMGSLSVALEGIEGRRRRYRRA